jgi:putative ABC transport system permease protein
MAKLVCRPARWVRRLVGGTHGEALAAEIEAEFQHRRGIAGRIRRRLALWSLWCEISPRLLLFAAQRAQARRQRAPRTGGFMDSVAYMLRSAARSLRLRPAFTAMVVLILALGIGANTAIFSVVNGVLLRPLAYADADALMTVLATRGGAGGRGSYMSHPDLADLAAESPSIERLTGFSETTATLTGMGEPALLAATRVSDGLLATFSLAPQLGRDVRADEFGANAAAVVLISDAFWRQYFGGRPDVIGQTLVLNGALYEIVGVAPAGFDFPAGTDLWYPRHIDPEGCGRDCHTWRTIGRLAPGATLAAAQAEADAIAANLAAAFPDSNFEKGFQLTSLRDETVGSVRVGLWVLLGAVGVVLLIACANVANLMLARAASRQGEVALRAALGASPRQLAGALLVESGLLALLGAAGGLLLARGGVVLLLRLSAGNLPRTEMIALDGTVLLFTLGLAVLVALLFGAAPALQLARLPLSISLGSAGRGSDLAAGSRRLRAALTAAEVALSVVLLVAAGLLLRTFFQLHAVDPGFETRHIVRFSLWLPEARYAELDHIRATFREIEANIAAIPGVEAVGSVYGAPMDVASTAGDVIVEGVEPPPPGRENGAAIRPMGPGYLETMRIPLLAGRLLQAADDAGSADVAVVNQAFVRENFPDRDPLGARVRVTVDQGFGSPYWTIVGVVGDVRSSALTVDPRPEVYVPHGRFGAGYLTLNVRTAAEARARVDAIRSEVRAVDPDLPLQRIETIDEVVQRAVAPTRFFLVGVSAFAGIATLLAAVGLYSVMAYLVSQRTREIGVRVALGADSSRIVRMVVGDGMRPAGLGLAVGLAIALAGTRLIESLLFGVAAWDPLTLLAVPATLGAVVITAIVLPALRASRVDPLRTLRSD